MNRDRADEFDGSDSSDDDFCPEKEAGDGAESDAPTSGEEEDELSDMEAETKIARNKQRKSNGQAVQHAAPAGDALNTNARRSTRLTEAVSKPSAQDKDLLESDDDEKEKSRSDALWADFLSDVNPTEKPAAPSSNRKTDTTNKGIGVTSETKKSDKLEAIAKPTPPASIEEKPKALTVTEVVDFAGEEVHVQRTAKTDSIKENKTALNNRTPTGTLLAGLKRPATSGGGGLGSLLNQIGKKKKISVLEKTQLDWKNYKVDEGIDEELRTHNKGKDGYLERQDFLERTDVRQFEIEKSLRQSRRTH